RVCWYLMKGGRHLAAGLTIASLVAGACGDLFHSTEWNTLCADNPPTCPSRTTGTSGGGGGGAPSCPKDRTLCSGECVDTNTDGANCGGCGVPCIGGLVCSAGSCTDGCPSPTKKCGTSCIDIQSDVAHCGSCDVACAAGSSCVMSQCVL